MVADPRFERELEVMSLKCCQITLICEILTYQAEKPCYFDFVSVLKYHKIGAGEGSRTLSWTLAMF